MNIDIGSDGNSTAEAKGLLLDSRYIRKDDRHFTSGPPGFEGKYGWVAAHVWNRKYEYCFAAEFIRPNLTVSEIGVGTFHPCVFWEQKVQRFMQ